MSASLPLGFYRMHAVESPVQVGMLVTVRTPQTVVMMRTLHGWLMGSMPLLKPVAAVAGNRVCHWDGQLWVEGQDYGLVFPEPLPPVLKDGECLTVAAGQVFLASAIPKSLDSRYVGLVEITDLAAQASPLVTWE